MQYAEILRFDDPVMFDKAGNPHYNAIIIIDFTIMSQKIIKVGTSAAVTIPKAAMEVLGLKVGDLVNLEVDKRDKGVRIEPAFVADTELIEWTKKFIERYKPALQALAKK
ncbi:MAG: hypothetical protein ACD_76C00161G0015 [uncultured bacterium]|nr:MAG: hypothetical protein ACD_76C00161G0015 [uncultured bacterium]